MKITDSNTLSPLIIYDGICHLCNRSVNFILKQDRKKIFCFTPFQSSFASNLLKDNSIDINAMETVILFIDGKFYTRSDAALKIALLLGGKWILFYPLYIFPKFIRNGFYNIIARNRYKWFGKVDSCLIPNHETQERFIL